MTMAFDFKKEYKEFYMPKNRPEIVTVPKANYIAVRGKGDPNDEGGAYQQAVGILYAVAYTLKMSYKTEYRIEGFEMFDAMVDRIREDTVHMLLTVEIKQNPNAPQAAPEAPKREQVAKPTGEGAGGVRTGTKGAAPVRVVKVGRNDPCPCGSGKKWKKCTCKQYHPDLAGN